MIVTRLKGGLGNQMFQYAFGYTLSKLNNDTLLIDASGYSDPRMLTADTPRAYELKDFAINTPFATPEQITKSKYPYGKLSLVWRAFRAKILRQFYLDYHPHLLAQKGDVYVDGFFQSELYWKNRAPEIRALFSLRPEAQAPIQNKIDQIKEANVSISIHIRRGDYASDPSTLKQHGLCSPEYYANAIAFLDQKFQNTTYFVFSDDIEWVKNNIAIPNAQYISDGSLSPAQEMHLMSCCAHHIIANSTFSWWGAWLNPSPTKIVIAPEQWTAKKPQSHKNILPESWIKLP